MDGIFRNHLRDYNQSAPGEVWDNIEHALDAGKRAKKLTLYKIAAAIAALAILGSSYLYFSSQEVKVKNQMAAVEEQKSRESVQHENQNNLNREVKQQSIQNKESLTVTTEDIAYSEKKNTSTNKNEIPADQLEQQEIQLTGVQDKRRTELIIQKLNHKDFKVLATAVEAKIIDPQKQKVKSVLNSLPDVYSHSFTASEWNKENESKTKKWFIGGDFSPLYSYRNITDAGDNNSRDFYNSVEKPIMSYSGGLNLQYKAVDRLTIQAGVYYTTMGQSFDYMSVYANTAYELVDAKYKDRFINSYSIENSIGEVSFNSRYVIVDNKADRVENLSNNKTIADVSDPVYNNLGSEIQQNFQYLEIPFLMRYKIVDKEFDINIVGGFGANFLIGNDVFFKYAGNKELIGETEGVTSINYNSTIGFGIEYPIVKRINIRLEPSIKYYLNEINSNSSVESHPYSIGIYTGINYSF